jgi:hypothetical protein
MGTDRQTIPINQKKGCPVAWILVGIEMFIEKKPEEMNQKSSRLV